MTQTTNKRKSNESCGTENNGHINTFRPWSITCGRFILGLILVKYLSNKKQTPFKFKNNHTMQ